MAFIDYTAAADLKELREERGFNSPEALAQAIKLRAEKAEWGEKGAVDAHTIRRVEKHGHKPGPRARFVLAMFFDRRPDEIWRPGREQSVEVAA